MKIRRQGIKPKDFLGVVLSAASGDYSLYQRAVSLFRFESRDIWVGLYWDASDIEYGYAKDYVRSTYRWCVNIYICPLPCCLLRFAVECGRPRWKRGDMSVFERGVAETQRAIAAQAPLRMPVDRSAMIERAIESGEPQ